MTGMDLNDDDPALAETMLRQALRLETDEFPPRLDAVALAATAARRPLRGQVLGVLRSLALVGVAIGIETAVAIVALNAFADLDLSGPAAVVLIMVAAIAEQVVRVSELTATPSVALATLAAVLLAIVHERGSGRELINVRAS